LLSSGAFTIVLEIDVNLVGVIFNITIINLKTQSRL
jgi:hypothetical protein